METDAYDDDLPACASCDDAQKDYDNLEMVANNLAAIVRRLAHALRDVSPTHDLPGKALDYLKREGFAGQPIRKVGACETAKPNCDRSACGDFKPGPCDHPDCPAIGKAPDDMIAMENAQGKKFALKFNPAHPQHGWIFYDNHGQWVTLRRALPHEIERAKGILEMRQVLAGIPCKA